MPYNNPHGPNGQWPDEHTNELIRLAGENLSYRAIATALNAKFGTQYNRNCTIGKAHRIGLGKKPAVSVPGNRKPRPKSDVKREPRKRIATMRIVPANGNSNAMRIFTSVTSDELKLRCVDIVPLNIQFADLEPHHCRYPQDAGFCGHLKATGSSYCDAHHALCHEQPRAPILRFAGVAA